MNTISYVGIAVVAYLLGSIPFGLILVQMVRGEDVRLSGSGNIGATNVARTGGKGLGVATLLLDALKGYIAVAIAIVASRRLPDMQLALAASLAALCAILGHVFPVWLKFHGGKGVATFRYVSLGSIVASAVFPVLAFFLYRGQSSPAGLAVMLGASLLIIFKHRPNIRRLLNGTENRLQFHKS